MDPNSETSLIFFNLIDKSTSSYQFNKIYFKLLESNHPILHVLNVNKIYFPPILESYQDNFFNGKYRLHLIKFEIKESLIGEDPPSVKLYYSNLDHIYHFVDSNTDFQSIKDDFKDGFLRDQAFQRSSIKANSFTKHGNETISFVCPLSGLQSYHKKCNRKLVSKLKSPR